MSSRNEHKIMVKRFSKTFIVAHWLYAFVFFALLLTGLPLYSQSFSWLYLILGGPEQARILHRIFAVLFVVPILILLLFDRKSLFHWLKQMFTWKKHDFQFFLAFPKEFLGFKAKVPKQDFYNAGEKLNSIIQIGAAILFIVSGVMMWFSDLFPKNLQLWGYPLHVIAFGLSVTTVIGHIFLAIGHPGSKISMRGMTKGDVPLHYVKHHHGRWYDELMQNQKADNEPSRKREV